MTAFDIVGYDFKGDRLCPTCVVGAISVEPGEALDGWDGESVEQFLQILADARQIDRVNSRGYSASQFPKVVFRGHVHGIETCNECETQL